MFALFVFVVASSFCFTLCQAVELSVEVDGDSPQTTAKIGVLEMLDLMEVTESYGLQQNFDHLPIDDGVAPLVRKMDQYMKNVVQKEEKYSSVRGNCQNRHELCVAWALKDECENNPGYMQVSCAPACQSCHMLNFELRCPVDPNATVAWNSGDLNKFFEGLTTDPAYQKYQPAIISRPGMPNPKTNSSPWIVVLDNFLTDEECDTMIELGAEQGYQRSLDVGDETFDGSVGLKENERRTSVNAWCLPPCYDHPTTKQVIAKLENVTGISDNHSEYLQLLKYETGQYYESHHDFPPYTLKRPQGPRILTVFLYLNDVEAGGGTRFTDLDLTVMPKKGRALLWPSVLDENPMAIDMRMHHEALAVEKGVKYGANAWVHLRDFKTPFKINCT